MSEENAFNGEFAQSPTDNRSRQNPLYDNAFELNNRTVEVDEVEDVYHHVKCQGKPGAGMKGIHSIKPTNDVSGADNICRLAFEKYLHRNEESGTKSLAVLIDEVVRQENPNFHDVIDAMRHEKCKIGILISC
eukprot:15364492-Ditylum_brightwellii.AAC.1